jgi:hypothetical protein
MLNRTVVLAAALVLLLCAAAPASAGVPKTLILEHFADYFG